MAPFGVQRELILLGHYFCTCWISRGAGQPGWNSSASWVQGDAIKKSLWPMRGVISLFHRPNKRPHSPPFLWFCLAREPQTKVKRLELFTGKMDKGLICIDFAAPQWESFLWFKRTGEWGIFFVQKNYTIKINGYFNMAIKEENCKTAALFVY